MGEQKWPRVGGGLYYFMYTTCPSYINLFYYFVGIKFQFETVEWE